MLVLKTYKKAPSMLIDVKALRMMKKDKFKSFPPDLIKVNNSN